MANELLDDYEQSERVREWIKTNGGAMIMGVLLALGGYYGWQWWEGREAQASVVAATEFNNLVNAVGSQRMDDAVDRFELLKNSHEDTPYAAMGALHIAKLRYESGQKELALQALDYAAEHGEPAAVRHVALQRKARVQLDLGDTDAALATLEQIDGDAFISIKSEIRGDALLARGETEAAADAYEQALNTAEESRAALLELKINALGVAADSGAES